MRTLMLLGNLEVGGAEVMAVRVAAGLRQRGQEVLLASLKADGPLRERIDRAGLTLRAGMMRFRYDLAAAWRIARLLEREAIDTLVVVDIYRNAMICGLLGARLARREVRTVLWASAVPGGQAGDFTPRLRRAVRRGRLHNILCVSDRQHARLVVGGIDQDRLDTIPNGVDVPAIRSESPAVLVPPPRGPVVLCVANVMPDKDHATLLEAAGLLHRRGVSFELLLAGRGTEEPGFAKLCRELAGQAPVRRLGLRGDVAGLLAGSAVFTLSSTSEVCNVALLEAFAAGVPAVTTDIPGFAEVFIDGEQGLKVPPRDPSALAEALQRVLTDAQLRARLASAAPDRARAFSLERTVEAFAEYLAGLARRAPGGYTG